MIIAPGRFHSDDSDVHIACRSQYLTHMTFCYQYSQVELNSAASIDQRFDTRYQSVRPTTTQIETPLSYQDHANDMGSNTLPKAKYDTAIYCH